MYAENSWNATNLAKLLSIILPADLLSYMGQKKWIEKCLLDPEIFQKYMDKTGNIRAFFICFYHAKLISLCFEKFLLLKK